MMQPTPVRVGVMDSQRPGLVVTLPVEQLSSRARLGRGACPKCTQPVPMTSGLAGWPARVHCRNCGAMVELNPAVQS